MKKYSRDDQRAMAIWALDCAGRVLNLFEDVAPGDSRPRAALEAGADWVRTGEFSMAVIRKASLDAHAAAKDLKGREKAACEAAHAAGQAVATAHVPQHAYGGAWYALKAIAATGGEDVLQRVVDEREWQARHLPEHLRAEMMDRIQIEERRTGLFIRLVKGHDF
ncbi:hypothetical protein LG324_03245 [Phycicoccus jejuensis]|uniref:putative immunity protein n=1 Tax=Phycicoccus jejuensis TaxID=367299 RepID=UPI0038504073